MPKRSLIIWILILTVVMSLTIPYAWYLLKVIFVRKNVLYQLEIFKWVAIGFAVFAILRRYTKGNLEFAETFSHKLTHTIFAVLFNLQVVEFHTNQRTGYMMAAQRNVYKAVPISLAPYCFPLFTFILLSFRWLMDFHCVWIYDILIDGSLCFHYFCFKTQIGNHQSDINQYPLLLSYSHIVTSWLIAFCVIVPSFFPNMNGHGSVEPIYSYGVFSSVCRLLETWWNNLYEFITLIV